MIILTSVIETSPADDNVACILDFARFTALHTNFRIPFTNCSVLKNDVHIESLV